MRANIPGISHKTYTEKSNPSHELPVWAVAQRAPTTTCTWPCSQLLGLRISFRYLRSLSLVLNLVHPAGKLRLGLVLRRRRCYSSPATIIINNQAAAPVSRIAFVSSDVLLPLLAKRKVKRFFLVSFFLRLTRRLIPLGIFAPLTWIAFWGNYVYPAHRSFNVL